MPLVVVMMGDPMVFFLERFSRKDGVSSCRKAYKGNNVFSAMKFKTNYINRFYTSEEEYLKVFEGESPRTYMAESQNDSEAEGKNDSEAECQNDSETENQSGSEAECQNYLSDTVNTDAQNVTNILKDVRIKNFNRLIIGNLNINSITNKFDQLKAVIPGCIDILVLVETNTVVSFPESQLIIEGYSILYRLDRNRNGGGVMIYVREDIPSKELKNTLFQMI